MPTCPVLRINVARYILTNEFRLDLTVLAPTAIQSVPTPENDVQEKGYP